jgi:hypothetical protein
VFIGLFAYLKHYLRDFVQVAFLGAQNAENEFAYPFDTFKHRFNDFNKTAILDVQTADYAFPGPFSYFKNRFRDIVQVVLWKPRKRKISSHGLPIR